MSLSRPFLAAGAQAVVGTLQRVRDAESSRFFDDFDPALETGNSSGDSLWAAKRARIAAQAPPAAWAGFVLLGNGEASRRIPDTSHSRAMAGLVCAAGLMVAVGVRLRLAPRRAGRGRQVRAAHVAQDERPGAPRVLNSTSSTGRLTHGGSERDAGPGVSTRQWARVPAGSFPCISALPSLDSVFWQPVAAARPSSQTPPVTGTDIDPTVGGPLATTLAGQVVSLSGTSALGAQAGALALQAGVQADSVTIAASALAPPPAGGSNERERAGALRSPVELRLPSLSS